MNDPVRIEVTADLLLAAGWEMTLAGTMTYSPDIEAYVFPLILGGHVLGRYRIEHIDVEYAVSSGSRFYATLRKIEEE